MTKALVTAHLGRHFTKFGNYDYKVLISMGYEVHVAANFSNELDIFNDPNVIKHQIDFDRNPFKATNIKAYKQLRNLLNNNHFDIIQTQSPSGGVVTRLAALKAKKNGTKVIYTAHGFHFYKGAPLINWWLYYSIEKFLFKTATDCLITINEEDHQLAIRRFKNNSKIKHIYGVGVDMNKFSPIDVDIKVKNRGLLGYSIDDFILIYAAELNDNKNQEFLIDVMKKLDGYNDDVKLLLVGTGKKINDYKLMVEKYELSDRVIFTGYRNDVNQLFQISDVCVATSIREGLGLNIIEAMACSKPVIATQNRGHNELIDHGANGFLIKNGDIEGFKHAIEHLKNNKEKRENMGRYSMLKAEKYSLDNVRVSMETIYRDVNRSV